MASVSTTHAVDPTCAIPYDRPIWRSGGTTRSCFEPTPGGRGRTGRWAMFLARLPPPEQRSYDPFPNLWRVWVTAQGIVHCRLCAGACCLSRNPFTRRTPGCTPAGSGRGRSPFRAATQPRHEDLPGRLLLSPKMRVRIVDPRGDVPARDHAGVTTVPPVQARNLSRGGRPCGRNRTPEWTGAVGAVRCPGVSGAGGRCNHPGVAPTRARDAGEPRPPLDAGDARSPEASAFADPGRRPAGTSSRRRLPPHRSAGLAADSKAILTRRQGTPNHVGAVL